MLRKGKAKFISNFEDIQPIIKSRSCLRHWSAEMTDKLIELFRIHGTDYDLIASKIENKTV